MKNLANSKHFIFCQFWHKTLRLNQFRGSSSFKKALKNDPAECFSSFFKQWNSWFKHLLEGQCVPWADELHESISACRAGKKARGGPRAFWRGPSWFLGITGWPPMTWWCPLGSREEVVHKEMRQLVWGVGTANSSQDYSSPLWPWVKQDAREAGLASGPNKAASLFIKEDKYSCSKIS